MGSEEKTVDSWLGGGMCNVFPPDERGQGGAKTGLKQRKRKGSSAGISGINARRAKRKGDAAGGRIKKKEVSKPTAEVQKD